jgi:hypothetical protein
MSIDNFIPEIWSAEVLRNLHKNFVYAALCNRNYEGDIAEAGDTVRINAIGPVSVQAYTKNSDMQSPPALTDAQTVLTISRADYFNFQIDDVDKAQARGAVMNEAMYEAGISLAQSVDAFIAAMYTQAAAANNIGTTAAQKTDLATAGQPYVYLTQLKRNLDIANVPNTDRWVVVPPWFEALLLQDDRFVRYGTESQTQRLVEGVVGPTSTMAGNVTMMIGRAMGFDIYRSNNVPSNANGTDTYRIVAGHPLAWTYASQLAKVEAYRPQLRFGDAIKGLHLFGGVVVKPAALAVLTAQAA